MDDTGKYLIKATITAEGVVERSDVVGAVYGQTEGLLGDELDLRDLQDSSKVGRIDVDIESEGGRSFGTVRIATGLNRTETAVLAAALETIERVGPSRAECTVREIEDARAAKRREIVDRATNVTSSSSSSEILCGFGGVEVVGEIAGRFVDSFHEGQHLFSLRSRFDYGCVLIEVVVLFHTVFDVLAELCS